VYSVERLR